MYLQTQANYLYFFQECKGGNQNSKVKTAGTQAILNTSKTPMIHLSKDILDEFINFSKSENGGVLSIEDYDKESNSTTFRANPPKNDPPSREPCIKTLNSVKDSKLNSTIDISKKVTTTEISHDSIKSNESFKDISSKSVSDKKNTQVRSGDIKEINSAMSEGVIEESVLEGTLEDQVLLEESLLKSDGDLQEDFDVDARSEAILLKDPIAQDEVKENGVNMENSKAITENPTTEIQENQEKINQPQESNSSRDRLDVEENKISASNLPSKSSSTSATSNKETRRSLSNSSTLSLPNKSQTLQNNLGQSSNSKKKSENDNTKQNLPLNFTDAFKSLEVDYELGMQRPTSVTPATDSSQISCVSSDLTELQTNSSLSKECKDVSTMSSKSDNQGKKRVLEFGEVLISEKPDLKKVRVFKNRNASEVS